MRKPALAIALSMLCYPLFCFSAAPSAQAAEPAFSSAYTDLAKDCRAAFAATEIEEGQDMPLRCSGPRGRSLYIYFSAEDTYLQVEATGDTASLLAQPLKLSDYDRGKVEWRLADGVPFAIVVRVRGESRQTLEVRGIGAYRTMSDSIDTARRSSANADARAVADDAFLRAQR
ncbi:MAG: hypothetical protein KA144_13465 [Xanthomonadaceae bacterium]|nr:hypothetical protein [Xanthomonadaceae bacterium]